jgi:hypothetical protein
MPKLSYGEFLCPGKVVCQLTEENVVAENKHIGVLKSGSKGLRAHRNTGR